MCHTHTVSFTSFASAIGMWGSMAIPRIGQEVIVEFLEGDPDQPIVTGRTYHDVNRTPYRLPEHKTRMTIKSKTHKGDGFNELRFEDEKGVEEIFIKAEKDYNTYVQNNKTEAVLNSSVRQVNIDDLTRIGANSVQTVGMQKKINVGHSYVLNTGSFDTHDEHKLYWKKWENMLKRPLGKLQGFRGLRNSVFSSMPQDMGLDVFDSEFDLSGSYNLNVATVSNMNIGYSSTETVGQTKSVSVGVSMSLSAGEDIGMNSQDIDIGAMKEINIRAGSTLIRLDGNGKVYIDSSDVTIVSNKFSVKSLDTISLDANNIEINGTSNIKLKSAKIDLN